MTHLLSADPGQASGLALGYYDATTPYRLLERYQVLGGLDGFLRWWHSDRPDFDELVVEKFILDSRNEFVADLTPKEIEGALAALLWGSPIQPVYQPRTDKAALVGYPASAKTKAQRQRVRFDFLDRFGMFKPGTQNDDSNDAITHGLVYLKRRKHAPTLRAFWPPRTA